MSGMRELADRFGVELVGGDTNAWDGPLVISVTAARRSDSAGCGPARGSQPGDAILVTGPLGGSLGSPAGTCAPSRESPRPWPCTRLVPIHALIDISDGLSSDLGHILTESGGLGAVLDESAIPIHPDALAMSRHDGTPALDHALNDGEDFELCLVVSADDAARLLAAPPAPAILYRVGLVTELPGLRLRGPDSRERPITPGGFDHLAVPT